MKVRAQLACLAAGAAAALALPLTAWAADSFTFSVSPTTHGASSTTTSVLTVAKILSAQETVLPAGEAVCHHGAACSPADNTKVGTTSVQGNWVFLFCGSSTQNFDATWVANDGSYTPPTGWSIVAQVNNVNSLATVKSWVIEDAGSNYRIEVPSLPTLTCSGHTTKLTTTLGTYNGTTYQPQHQPQLGRHLHGDQPPHLHRQQHRDADGDLHHHVGRRGWTSKGRRAGPRPAAALDPRPLRDCDTRPRSAGVSGGLDGLPPQTQHIGAPRLDHP